MRIKYIIVAILVLTFELSCAESKDHIIDSDIRLWEGTKGWSLAKAVKDEDSVKINKILAKKEITIDFREPKFGQNLLMWAVLNNKTKAVRILLNLGADPNLHDTYKGESPILEACEIGVNIDILKLILNYGGNPNNFVSETEELSEERTYETPLIRAAMTSFEKSKLLVEHGADVNMIIAHKGRVNKKIIDREMPLMSAVIWNRVDIVSYLIFEKGADFKETFGITIDGDTITFAKMLRKWDFPLDSKEYKEKMRIVKYLKENGQDYWSTPIPKEIEKHYPKEYLEKY